jgi:3-isopropylmalate dehydratase small subunit
MPEPVRAVVGKAAPLEADNIDTDQIIPAQFLMIIERKGLGRYLFYRKRYNEKGDKIPGFILDQDEFKNAKILVAGRNFGIGSSRENAVWALTDFGIKCIIASSFGDIFYGNASKNGLVCVRLDIEKATQLRDQAKNGKLVLTVNIENQVVEFLGESIKFEMEPHIKDRLVKGLDEIAITLSGYEDRIREYEAKMPQLLIPGPRRFLSE